MTVLQHSGTRAVAGPDGARPMAVGALERVADDVLLVTLVDPDGGRLPAWTAGAHIDVTGPTGVERQYSLCGDPADGSGYRIAVLRVPDGRGGSAALHAGLREGDLLPVRGPRNHFRLTGARRLLFVAGGIGVTPIRSMIAAARAWDVPWELHWAGRSRSAMPFLDELEPLPEVTVHVSAEGDRMRLADVLRPRTGTAVYCCGPVSMIAEAEERCRADWPPRALHVERFGVVAGAEPELTGAPFDLELARSGRTLHVPADRTALDVLAAAGAAPPSSCRQGVCGSCEVRVLDGLPEHRDSMSHEEDTAMYVCVSRARTPRLVLDL